MRDLRRSLTAALLVILAGLLVFVASRTGAPRLREAGDRAAGGAPPALPSSTLQRRARRGPQRPDTSAASGAGQVGDESGSVTVTVGDEDGNPLPGVEVALGAAEGATRSVTDASGIAAFRRIEPGSYILSVRGGPFPPLAALSPVVVGEASHVVRDVVVPTCDAWLAGTVSDHEGRPIAGAPIQIRPLQDERDPATEVWFPCETPSTVSGPDGAFSFDGLEVGKYVVVVAARESHLSGGRICSTGDAPCVVILESLPPDDARAAR